MMFSEHHIHRNGSLSGFTVVLSTPCLKWQLHHMFVQHLLWKCKIMPKNFAQGALQHILELCDFLVLLITSECLFLLGRRHGKQAINCSCFFTWHHIWGQFLSTDDISGMWMRIKERIMVYQIYFSCSHQFLQENGSTETPERSPLKVTSALIFIPITPNDFKHSNECAHSNAHFVLSVFHYTLGGPHPGLHDRIDVQGLNPPVY